MSELAREWIEEIVVNGYKMREQHLRLVIRDRPRWLPERVWRWVLQKLLVLEERELI